MGRRASSTLVVAGSTVVVAVALLVAAHRLMNPAPTPAAGAILGGLIGLTMRNRRVGLPVAVLAGCVAGAAIHGYSHQAEGRIESLPGFVAHVVGDAALGLLLGSAVIAAAVATEWLARRLTSRDRPA